MMALLAAVVVAQPVVSAEASGAFALSLRPAYGALAGATVSDGWWEGGVLLGYQAEPWEIFDAYLGGAHVHGATHRLQVLGTAGARFTPWRFTLSPHLVIGWSKVWLAGTFDNDAQGIHGRLDETVGAFTLGLGLAVAFKLVDRLHLRARVIGPLPFSSGVTGYCTFTLGAVYDF